MSGASDPSAADSAAGLRYAFSCTNGDLSGVTYATADSSPSTTCTVADNGSYAVRARVIDKDGGSTEYTTTVAATNVAPTISALTASGASGPACASGRSVTLGFSFEDPAGAADSYAGTIDWGDGSTTAFGATSPVTEAHSYARAGQFTITSA
jgi:hypothetical protein